MIRTTPAHKTGQCAVCDWDGGLWTPVDAPGPVLIWHFTGGARSGVRPCRGTATPPRPTEAGAR